jgi:hypothetical protein
MSKMLDFGVLNKNGMRSPFMFRFSLLCAAKAAVVFVSAAGLVSCASVSVKKTEHMYPEPPRSLPDKIFIKPFDFFEPGLRVDRSGENLEHFKFDAQERLSKTLVARLTKHVAPAVPISANAPLPKGNYWLITGRIDRIYQGSRAMRALVGFGLGGTKFETTAVISDLSVRPPRAFLLIETTGGSNASPGAIGTATYFIGGITALGSLGNLLEGVRTGVSFDTIRTSKELSAALSEYLYQQRAIPHEKAHAPKRPGHWQPDFWPFRRAPKKLPEGSITVVPVEP